MSAAPPTRLSIWIGSRRRHRRRWRYRRPAYEQIVDWEPRYWRAILYSDVGLQCAGSPVILACHFYRGRTGGTGLPNENGRPFAATPIGVARKSHCQMFQSELPKGHKTNIVGIPQCSWGVRRRGVRCGWLGELIELRLGLRPANDISWGQWRLAP